jgi:hypothetical protein
MDLIGFSTKQNRQLHEQLSSLKEEEEEEAEVQEQEQHRQTSSSSSSSSTSFYTSFSSSARRRVINLLQHVLRCPSGQEPGYYLTR